MRSDAPHQFLPNVGIQATGHPYLGTYSLYSRVQASSVRLDEPIGGSPSNYHQLKNHRSGGFLIGGGGGNRTRVRKSSTDSSTYLAMLFSLTRHPPTGGLMTGESPIV